MIREPSSNYFALIQKFVASSEDGQVTDEQRNDFEDLLRESDDARQAYSEYVEQTVFLRACLLRCRVEFQRTVRQVPAHKRFVRFQPQPCSPRRSRSKVLALVKSLVGIGRAAPAASASSPGW